MGEDLKQKVKNNIDVKLVVTGVVTMAAFGVCIYALKKLGAGKAAAVLKGGK